MGTDLCTRQLNPSMLPPHQPESKFLLGRWGNEERFGWGTRGTAGGHHAGDRRMRQMNAYLPATQPSGPPALTHSSARSQPGFPQLGAGAESPTNGHPPAFPSAGRGGRRWPTGWLKEGHRNPTRMASSCLRGAWTWLGSTRTDRSAPSAGPGCPTIPQRASPQGPSAGHCRPAGGRGEGLASEVTAARALAPSSLGDACGF